MRMCASTAPNKTSDAFERKLDTAEGKTAAMAPPRASEEELAERKTIPERYCLARSTEDGQNDQSKSTLP